MIGDHSTSTLLNSGTDNRFTARFAGGYRFYTSSDLSTFCTLAGGDNAQTTGSDVNQKGKLCGCGWRILFKKDC